jgi:glycosyltransferase involved in cell wall biosynthesis
MCDLITKKISAKINSRQQSVVFGCNSKYFYDLLPQLNSSVKKIDLVHAFVHNWEEGSEHYSLPVVTLLDKRIVINNKTLKDFKQFYSKHHVNESLLERFVCIYNKTFIPETRIAKDYSDEIKIIYVGRNTHEKRVHLFAEIVKKMSFNKRFHFYAIGEGLDKFFEIRPKNLTLTGVIEDENEMRKIYSQSHILLLFSSREGLPMVIMEAQAHGVVCISTNVGGICEVINDKQNGYLLNAELNEKDVVNEAIKEIEQLINDPVLFSLISANAYKTAKEKFSARQFEEGYRALFNFKHND